MSTLDDAQFANNFWAKVDTANECWNWLGARQSKNYGSFGVNGRTQLAHRVAYQLEVGPIPEGKVVRHRCDNPGCCNPKHLEIGTIADNNRDAQIRGRNARGERNGRAKLKEAEVLKIREEFNLGKYSIPKLARLYLVSPNTIRNIVKNKYWNLPLAS